MIDVKKVLYVEDRDVNAGKNILRLGLVQSYGKDSSIERPLNHEAHEFIHR